jgi:hypothetical protein
MLKEREIQGLLTLEQKAKEGAVIEAEAEGDAGAGAEDALLPSLDPGQQIAPPWMRITTCLIFFDDIFCMGLPALRASGIVTSSGMVCWRATTDRKASGLGLREAIGLDSQSCPNFLPR